MMHSKKALVLSTLLCSKCLYKETIPSLALSIYTFPIVKKTCKGQMGICISHKLASSEIHESENIQENENVVYYGQNDENQMLGSLCSQEGTKGVNQDAAILYQGYGVEGGTFCGVFDGHGKNGHFISKIVRNRLPSLILNQKSALAKLNTFQDNEKESRKSFYRWREACLSAFKVMDKELKLVDSLDCSCSGTTAVVVIKQGEDLVIANLGDSRAMLGTIADDGTLNAVQLTTDLKPNLPHEAERIVKSRGRVLALKEEPHIHRVWLPNEDAPGLAMSRAFGDFLVKNYGVISIPDIHYYRVTQNDRFVVLASDGVWDVMSNDDVAAVVSGAGSEEEASKAVVDAAIYMWKHKFPTSNRDDCTAVCLFLHESC